MQILNWIKNLFKKEEINLEDFVLRCPKCNSDKIGYYTGLVNYVQVIQGKEDPAYKQTAKCMDCGFSVDSEIDDRTIGYLNAFIWEKK